VAYSVNDAGAYFIHSDRTNTQTSGLGFGVQAQSRAQCPTMSPLRPGLREFPSLPKARETDSAGVVSGGPWKGTPKRFENTKQ